VKADAFPAVSCLRRRQSRLRQATAGMCLQMQPMVVVVVFSTIIKKGCIGA